MVSRSTASVYSFGLHGHTYGRTNIILFNPHLLVKGANMCENYELAKILHEPSQYFLYATGRR